MLWIVPRSRARPRTNSSPDCSLNFLSKANQQQIVRAERFNRAQFLRQRINQRRHAVGRDDRIRMPVKRQHQRDGVVLARVGDGLPDDLLVAEMHAVEKRRWPGRPCGCPACSSFAAWMIFILTDTICQRASFKNGITLFSNSAAVNFKTASSGIASATSNLPETLRRSVARCAPQPSFWPRSCAMLRT